MGETITFFFVFLGVIAVTAVLFAIWVAAMLIRGVGRGLVRLFRIDLQSGASSRAAFLCPRPACRAVNPPTARFCRRCGLELLKSQFGCPPRW